MTTPLHILLLEDDPECADTLLAMFKRGGQFKLDTAATLKEALSKITGTNYDAVICDLRLPDAKGVEAPIAIHNEAPSTPIIALSGHYPEDDGSSLIASGYCKEAFVKGKPIWEALVRKTKAWAEYGRKNIENENGLKINLAKRLMHIICPDAGGHYVI